MRLFGPFTNAGGACPSPNDSTPFDKLVVVDEQDGNLQPFLASGVCAIAEDRHPDGDFEEGWHVCQVLEAVERSAAARRLGRCCHTAGILLLSSGRNVRVIIISCSNQVPPRR
jgi:hypothetical protein